MQHRDLRPGEAPATTSINGIAGAIQPACLRRLACSRVYCCVHCGGLHALAWNGSKPTRSRSCSRHAMRCRQLAYMFSGATHAHMLPGRAVLQATRSHARTHLHITHMHDHTIPSAASTPLRSATRRGNILVRPAPASGPGSCARLRLAGRPLRLAGHGLLATIIDFTQSRLAAPDGTLAFCDMAQDPGVFEGPKGHVQVGVQQG